MNARFEGKPLAVSEYRQYKFTYWPPERFAEMEVSGRNLASTRHGPGGFEDHKTPTNFARIMDHRDTAG